MAKRHQVVEIVAPTAGRRHDAPPSMIPLRAQPGGGNSKMYYGVNQKEYGTSLYATGTSSVLGTGINFIFDAQYPSSNVLEIFTHTGVHKYSSGTDSFVSDGQSFVGDQEDYWSGVMHNDDFIYTNGIDNIQIKSSVSATGTDMASSTHVAVYHAWGLASFREHLNLYHTIEGGTEHFKRVRWTKKGLLNGSAATTDFGSGTFGFVDIQDIEGEIKTTVPLGVTQAIYADRSIHLQSWIGGDQVYQFTKTISQIGTPSRRGAVSHGEVNFFIGHDSFYSYHGGDDIRDIGSPVRAQAFGEINNSAIATSFVEFDNKTNEVLFHIPVGSDSNPTVAWVFRIEGENTTSWSRLERPYTAKGVTNRKTGLTIGELQGSIGDQTFTYGDFFLRQEAEVKIYGDESGRLVKEDPATYSLSISGTNIAQVYRYETPDIVGYSAQGRAGSDPYDKDTVAFTTTTKRYTQFQFEATGNGLATVEYSTNKGSTWTVFPESPVTLSPSGTVHTLDLDVDGPRCRFAVSETSTNGTIGITYAKVEFVPGSEN